ncbi:flagellar biosynthetic protein FliR [Piscirickettsia salmonis]|uniref:flagellar biosynthetic protein FliR n=1 Tax=Piscirickettsia salmonis TaxID=1238 RepID=UPI0003059CC2|nr:flagellar biosynthetic protein FliR [Piscirickettsia salmonis]ALA24892.1 flagellar biosynthetic protein FliR [Piscirickettsia salmonis]APS45203.1 flagellar biosynthetic protein FliR [Piscirickettsia salmonis]APS48564.1 flagellar biosynthetic protein FliR [Piscirickettsia salmonis]APS49822.1 flagellar biosynthetic protein FliR [Piscirickettsia salmonis]APS53008.1 flagellar biosynthetic protein FliR [Piscirickettsia salmonis]
MLELTTADIHAWIAGYFWPFIRIAAMLMTIAVIGSQYVAKHVRLVLAVLITIVIVPVIPEVPKLDILSIDSVLITVQQVLIGIFIGFMTQLLFQIFVIGGQIIAMQMGLGFAALVDPQNGFVVTGVSQVYFIMVALLFFTMNGHLVFIQMVVESFTILPITADSVLSTQFIWLMLEKFSWVFAKSVLIALPAILSLLLINFSFGVMSRAAPQLNVFSIGFPTTLLMGAVVIAFVVFIINEHFQSYFVEISQLTYQMIQGMS